jgi:hypothetical protein
MDVVAAAVDNNARWCDVVCRLHGIATEHGTSYWSAADSPPSYLPERGHSATGSRCPPNREDACALCHRSGQGQLRRPRSHVTRLRNLVFSTVDDLPTSAADFTLPTGSAVLHSTDELEEWSLLFGAPAVLSEGLLREPDVRLLALREAGRIVAGAVAHRSANVVGPSNVFGANVVSASDRWSELMQLASKCFPRVPVVGYERGDALAAATSAGFVPIAPLRVWRPCEL